MRKILAKELKIKFVETLSDIDDFNYEDGNPFLIRIYDKQFFIFLKNLSPAYFKNSPDITRVQLPFSEHFNKIFKAQIPFIIFGYDADNDTMVCWNPSKIKERLNAKSNVSLYSRESLQSKVKNHEFKEGFLSNGEKIILFKRERLVEIFKIMNDLFNKSHLEKKAKKIEHKNNPTTENQNNKLLELKDKKIIKLINPLLKNNKVLEAVKICSEYYS
jgi:hypothetical protein